MAQIGLNYFYYQRDEFGRLPKPTSDKPRFFISHQKKNADVAKKIADYLEDAGIDTYFDQYDSSIDYSDPGSTVETFRAGIEDSSHMLLVFLRIPLIQFGCHGKSAIHISVVY